MKSQDNNILVRCISIVLMLFSIALMLLGIANIFFSPDICIKQYIVTGGLFFTALVIWFTPITLSYIKWKKDSQNEARLNEKVIDSMTCLLKAKNSFKERADYLIEAIINKLHINK